MADLSERDPTGRFSGLAEGYARHRPDYPSAALDALIERAELAPGARIVDVGSGTGISARLLAARGFDVLGVEPNRDMLRAAARVGNAGRAPRYVAARAEATGLAEGVATLVVAAQAFHWFRASEALDEFARILEPEGSVALIWNERDETDAFSARYGDVVRTGPGAVELESARMSAGRALLDHARFVGGARLDFAHAQELDEQQVLGRALSASHAPREPRAVADFTAALRRVFAAHSVGSRATLRYRTSIYVARKAR